MNAKRLLRHSILIFAWIFLVRGVAAADDAPKTKIAQGTQSTKSGGARAAPAKKDGDKTESADAKTLSGMSILGNQEAPKALVIVPWKSSQLGDTLGIDKALDDSRQPVDKEVFMRELAYYEIRHSASNPTSK